MKQNDCYCVFSWKHLTLLDVIVSRLKPVTVRAWLQNSHLKRKYLNTWITSTKHTGPFIRTSWRSILNLNSLNNSTKFFHDICVLCIYIYIILFSVCFCIQRMIPQFLWCQKQMKTWQKGMMGNMSSLIRWTNKSKRELKTWLTIVSFLW